MYAQFSQIRSCVGSVSQTRQKYGLLLVPLLGLNTVFLTYELRKSAKMVTALGCMFLIGPSGGPGGLGAVTGSILETSTGFSPYRMDLYYASYVAF